MPVYWPYPLWAPTRRDRRANGRTGEIGRPKRDRKKINAARRAARHNRG